MNTNQINDKTKKILQDYASLIGLPSGWESSLSINDFLTIRRFAREELEHRVYDQENNNVIDKSSIIETKTSSQEENKELNNKTKVIELNNSQKDTYKAKENIVSNKEEISKNEIDNVQEDEKEIQSKESRELALFSLLKD